MPLLLFLYLFLLLTRLRFAVVLFLKKFLPKITRMVIINPVFEITHSTRHHLPHCAFAWSHGARARASVQQILHEVSSETPLLHWSKRNCIPLLYFKDQTLAVIAPAVVVRLAMLPQCLKRHAAHAAELTQRRRLKQGWCHRSICHQTKVRRVK